MGMIMKKEDGGENGELDEEIVIGSEADVNAEIEKMLRSNTGKADIKLEFAAAQEQADEVIVRIDGYGLEENEQDMAVRMFQRMVLFRKCVRNTVLLGVAGAFLLIENLTSSTRSGALWLAFALCMAFIVIVWYNPVKIRKIYLNAMKEIAGDRYNFALYPDHLVISTVQAAGSVDKYSLLRRPDTMIAPEDEDFDDDEDDSDEEADPDSIIPRKIYFEDKSLRIVENADIFLLLYKTDLIYILPKRVMDSYTEKKLSEEFEAILGDEFQIADLTVRD
ncbi:MAG: hypothetical protein QM689_13135 [Oscillospiraceae bacterium]